MKWKTALTLFVLMVAAGTIANLIALKIAADQANAALADVKASSPLLSLLGKR